MVNLRDESIGFIAKGYKAINVDGVVYYVRDCEAEFRYVSDSETDIIRTCIDINGNTVKFIKRIIYEEGKVKNVSKWEIYR